MSLITVEVLAPAVNDTFDFRVPSKMKIADLKKHIIEDIRAFEGIDCLYENKAELFSSEKWFDEKLSLEEAGIQNGNKIMLI